MARRTQRVSQAHGTVPIAINVAISWQANVVPILALTLTLTHAMPGDRPHRDR